MGFEILGLASPRVFHCGQLQTGNLELLCSGMCNNNYKAYLFTFC